MKEKRPIIKKERRLTKNEYENMSNKLLSVPGWMAKWLFVKNYEYVYGCITIDCVRCGMLFPLSKKNKHCPCSSYLIKGQLARIGIDLMKEYEIRRKIPKKNRATILYKEF